MSEVTLDPQRAHNLSCLLRDKSAPMPYRFRALFTLRNFPKSIIAQSAIADAIHEENESHLLKHESVYCLGQMQSNRSTELFKSLVANLNENSMVRHEAAEALGITGMNNESIKNFLKEFENDNDELVRDTCILAIQRIDWKDNLNTPNKFDCLDPTPAHPSQDIQILGNLFCDSKTILFDRYRAMVALRNLETRDSINILCNELSNQRSGQALFRHELAFILGQLHHPNAINALITTLSNVDQHYVIRHESAFALGSVGGYAFPEKFSLQEKAREALMQFSTDHDRIVRESCIVGLDIMLYEDGDEFDSSEGITSALRKYEDM